MKKQEQELQKVTDETNPAYLLKLAIENKAELPALEKLMDLQERFRKTEAEKQFNIAMTNFQRNCPVIQKKKVVMDKYEKVRYKFAPIDDIIRQVKPVLSKENLFYDFDTEDSDGFIKVTCTVTHEKGHFKKAEFKVPIGKEDYMTDVQKYGARMTFAKRYAFCNALGITTADEDNDSGNTEKQKDVKPEEQKEVVNPNAMTEEDKRQIGEELMLYETEREIRNWAWGWEKYIKNLIFKGMVQKRIEMLKPENRMTEEDLKNYKRPKISKK
jgi:hypothetical protein